VYGTVNDEVYRLRFDEAPATELRGKYNSLAERILDRKL